MPGEPRTETGKRLLAAIFSDLEDQGGPRASIDDAKGGFRDDILAIETEAAAINPEWLARALQETRDLWFVGDRDSWSLAEPEGMAKDIAPVYDRIAKEGTPT